jgi:hypothetical protein
MQTRRSQNDAGVRIAVQDGLLGETDEVTDVSGHKAPTVTSGERGLLAVSQALIPDLMRARGGDTSRSERHGDLG